MIRTETHAAMTLADYEARIYVYKQQIGVGYIGIGRTLIEAKDAGVVPHGQWEEWVTAVTGLSARNAQRCMQAAREIRDGSKLAELEMSKALLLLSSGLDEEARERIAGEAAEENQTIRELRDTIERQKRELSAARGDLSAQGAELKDTRAIVEQLNRENVDMAGQLKRVDEYVECQKKQAVQDAMRLATDQLREEHEKELAARADEIGQLKDELAAAEEREEKRARELQRLREEQDLKRLDRARGVSADAVSAFDLGAAVRAFLGAAGVLPQMGRSLANLSPAERENVRGYIDTVANWVDGARAALGLWVADAQVR